ncbi:MAG: hypothetical protein ACRD2P_16750 [Terriglobia bacterium]
MKKISGLRRLANIAVLAAFLLPVLLLAAAPLAAANGQEAGGAHAGDFFIISSVNKKTHELFLKAPTEVTELMQVSGKTVFLDAQGKHISFNDLRAGSTVYVVANRNSGAEPIALRVEEGPMTTAILHQKYLK